MKKYVFFNFTPNNNISYGGGNIATFNIIQYFLKNNINITYDLSGNIDYYIIIDPNSGPMKKYSLLDVINHKNRYNQNGKIIIRVNDCDATRKSTPTSRETLIKKYFNEIDFFIFNSKFIFDYYKSKMNLNEIINSTIIYNGCDLNVFKYNQYKKLNKEKIRIVTHHWSNNMHKGYSMYLKLWEWCQKNDNFEFIFIGKNVPDMFKQVPIIGPYHGTELALKLRECDIYITDSVLDSCPNHVIEGICSGLPILYTRKLGGGNNLCKLPDEKIGEEYDDFDELIIKLKLIVENYDFYRSNIIKNIDIYSTEESLKKYINVIKS
jgi:hypothetical protein